VTVTAHDLTKRARMGRFVRRYPLVCFFALAYALSWLYWLPFVLAENTGLGVLPLRIPAVLGDTQLLGMLPGSYLGPITAALIVTAIAEGRAGLRRWARRLVRLRVGWRWYLAVLLGVPVVLLATTFVLPGAWADPRLPTAGLLLGYLSTLLVQLITTGLAEEPGWRDFALVRLQDRLGPISGTMLLGVLWGGWHLPLFLSTWGGWPHVLWYEPIEFVGAAIALSFPITWVFNRTGHSLPLVMLLHANVNTVFSVTWFQLFPSLDAFRDSLHVLFIASVLSAVVLSVATRGRLGHDTWRRHGPGATDAGTGRVSGR
jgi:membrane protease YdiL (CAAX protease family)